MSLRVGMDGSALVRPESGIGRYTDQLLRAFVLAFPEDHLVVFANRVRGGVTVPEGVGLVNPRIPARVLRWLWDRTGRPHLERFTGPVDVFHTSDWLHPPQRRGATVTTVHDVGALLHPEWYAPEIVRLHARQNELTAQRSTLIIAVSEATRERFLERYRVDPARIVVVPNGVSSEFRPPAPPDARATAARHGLPSRYVMYVGTGEARKNLSGLIRIFERVAADHRDLHLALVGPTGGLREARVHGVEAWTLDPLSSARSRSSLEGRVTVLGKVARSDLVDLYGGARALCFPTLYEGFGLTVLEAMACGCPVVSSSTSSIPEVAGEAGVLVDPRDEDAFADALVRVIGDEEYRNSLVRAGLARAARYPWSRTAEGTRGVYRSAADAAAGAT